jgi:tetratricopeptide (TPR) repeat protein
VTYNSVLVERRRAIHDHTARAIERLYAQQLENYYTELAHHYFRGNDVAKALRYVQLAAEQAVSRAAYREATSLLEAGLKLLDKLPDGVERPRVELAFRSIESVVAFAFYGPASLERERAARRMCELGEEIGEIDQILPGLIALGYLYFQQGEPLRALELSTRCLELAETTKDTGPLADTRGNLGLTAYSCGKLREAVSNYEDGIGVLDRTNRIVSTPGFLFRSGFLCRLALPRQLLGRAGEAIRAVEEGLRHARESKHVLTVGFALLHRGGFLAQYRHEPEIARALCEEVVALSEEYGFAAWLEAARFYHGWALAALGQLEHGVAEMEEAMVRIDRQSGFPWQQYMIALLAQGCAKMGRTEDALGMLNKALQHIERTGEKVHQAEMLRIKGDIRLMRDGGAVEEAEGCFRAGLDVARALEAKWWELRATTSLARPLRDTNRRDEARAMLTQIYRWFTEGFDTADLKDAKALLDELNA